MTDHTEAALAIDEGLFLDIGGQPQWVTIRGREPANPVLMIVTGAGAAFSSLAPVFAPWEASFTVVQWDQPRAGATLARTPHDPRPFTYARLAADGCEVAAAVCARLGAAQLVLFAISGGTITAMHMVRRRPDLFSAYVANGQVVDWRAQEATSYRLMLDAARASDDAAAVAEIEGFGAPPWADVMTELAKSRYANASTPAEQAAMAGPAWALVRDPPPGASWIALVAAHPEPMAAAFAAYQAIRAEMQGFDAHTLGLDWPLPMIFLQGAQDAHTTAAEVEAYAARITAPVVRYVPIPEGGHMSSFLIERLLALMDAHVVPLARDANRLSGRPSRT
jgi:pimeloyl-ACP methyl ester carboxylesterase